MADPSVADIENTLGTIKKKVVSNLGNFDRHRCKKKQLVDSIHKHVDTILTHIFHIIPLSQVQLKKKDYEILSQLLKTKALLQRQKREDSKLR